MIQLVIFCLFSLTLASVSLGIEVRIATWNIFDGIGDSSAPGRSETEAIILRIAPDILCLQEVKNADLNDGHLDDLAQKTGFPHLFFPTTALDIGSRVAILSKYPFVPLSQKSIISPPGANDVSRAAAAVIVDVPGTDQDPVIVTAHLKCCFEPDDFFRRAVEFFRIRSYLETLSLGPQDNVFVTGDFNLLGSRQTFSALPDGLPASFVLGDDVTFPVVYEVDPLQYLTGLGITNPGYRQQNGQSTATFASSSNILDFLLASSSITSRSFQTEIFNSELEGVFAGLPKQGSALSPSVSETASDHYPLFGDFELDQGTPFLLEAMTTSLSENGPATQIVFTLSQPAPSETEFFFQLSDPSEATLSRPSVTIEAGETTGTTTLNPVMDRILDGAQSIQVFAEASGYEGQVLEFQIQDSDLPSYSVFQFDTPVLDQFTAFSGEASPSQWMNSELSWQGIDDGLNLNSGGRSYGGSLGHYSNQTSQFETTIRNDSGQVIPALEISYRGQHWLRAEGDGHSQIECFLQSGNQLFLIPELTYRTQTQGPVGLLNPPETALQQAYLRGLNLQPGDSLTLVTRFGPEQSDPPFSDQIWVNEFHYDNQGPDQGEFIEVFVGADFQDPLSEVVVHLYNGNDGGLYGAAHALDTFTPSPLVGNGLGRLLVKEISGIQNGSPDGIALSIKGVLHEFLSYEGQFTATEGVATGMTSTVILPSQSASTPVGQNSLGRTGRGGSAADFAWEIQPANHSSGALNDGQTITQPLFAQGIALDDFQIVALQDLDGDLLPDSEEITLGTNPNHADTDGDGSSDALELLFLGTDPRSGLSRFAPSVQKIDGEMSISFLGLPGRTYRIDYSSNLQDWQSTPSKAGQNLNLSFAIPAGQKGFWRLAAAFESAKPWHPPR